MSIGSALARGARSANRRGVRLWFFGVTTLWALVIVAPVMAVLYSYLGHSAWTARMTANFDLQVVGELILSKSLLAAWPLLAATLSAAALAAVSHLFLVGGAIELFWSEAPFPPGTFFRGCGRYFWRFVRLAVVCGVLCIVPAIASSVLSRAGNKIWGESSEATPLVYWSWFRVAVVLLLFGFVNLISDYGRIHIVAGETQSAFRAAGASLRFVLQNFGKTARLYVLLCLMLLVLLAAYRAAEGVFGQSTLGLALALFVVRQATALARIWIQLLFYATETELYRALTPEPVPELPPAALMN